MSELSIEEWYQRLRKQSEGVLTEIKEHIEVAGGAKFPFLKCTNPQNQSMEIFAGSKRLLLRYSINPTTRVSRFVTEEIVPNRDNYGTYQVKDLGMEITFSSETNQYTLGKDQVYFADGYLNLIRKHFEEI